MKKEVRCTQVLLLRVRIPLLVEPHRGGTPYPSKETYVYQNETYKRDIKKNVHVKEGATDSLACRRYTICVKRDLCM